MAGDYPTNVMQVSAAAYKAGYEAAERDLAAARAELERVRDMAKLHGQHHRQCVRLLAGLAHTTDADCNCWLSQLDTPPPHAAANLASLEPAP